MCAVPLPPGVYPIAVDKYIISYHIYKVVVLFLEHSMNQEGLYRSEDRVMIHGDLAVLLFKKTPTFRTRHVRT